jgi:DNA polymerase III alpha subunit
MVEEKNPSSESSDSTLEYALDYYDLLDLFKDNYQVEEYDILYDDDAKELINNFVRKVPLRKKYFLRLSYELRLIKMKGFFKTFFQVIDILKIIDPDIPTVIRGSAGSSLVCYLLGITSVDPVKFKISLSRFMHEKRDDIPDIDIDFPAHLRESIYEQIYEKYPGRVARISNHLYYKPKSAIREAIRRAGYHRFIPKDFDLKKIFPEKDERLEVRKEAQSLEDKFSHYSLHCGGIIIFDEYVPEKLKLDTDCKKINKDKIKHTQIRLNKDEAEDAGMIKIDILSNRGLSQLICISNKKLNEYDWNDMKVWTYLSKGENLGLTHAESPAMKKILRLIKPKSIEELALCLAIIRPGATANGNKGNFMRNFYNNYLPKTDLHNIIIYDDDAIQVIQKLLGCSESTADYYRRGFAKGRRGILIQNELKKKLDEISLSYVQKELLLFQLTQLEDFTFCKSHAFSYALLIFALAYNKYYKAKKFWVATLNHANSGYRKWVHYRCATNNGLKIEYGRGMYTMEDNTNVTCDKLDIGTNDICGDFLKFGWWNQYDFLPGMFVEIDDEIIEENKKKVKKVKFKGLIAIYRPYVNTTQAPNTNTQNLNNNTSSESSSRKLTFVSIGIDNNEFYDCVLWGLYKLNNHNFISGNGIYHFNDVSPWIEVKKFKVN